jgi:hypothetical protein
MAPNLEFMKYHSFLFAVVFTGLALSSGFGHGHINAGITAVGSTQLAMHFEPETETTELVFNGGLNAYGADGFLWNGFTTLTALHQGTYPDEAPNYNILGAASGSYLVMELVSISGPAGARFAFYDSLATDPLWVFEIGTGFIAGDPATQGVIKLTDDAWFEAFPSDPYGHYHDRTFGVDQAGIYTVQWVLRDTRGLMQDSEIFSATYVATPLPEPSAGLLVLGAAGLWGMRRNRREIRRGAAGGNR